MAKRSVNPVWNYTFAYDDVSLNELSERALELTIWDHDRLASNEFLGGVRFSLGTGKFLTLNQTPVHIVPRAYIGRFHNDLTLHSFRMRIIYEYENCRFCVQRFNKLLGD